MMSPDMFEQAKSKATNYLGETPKKATSTTRRVTGPLDQAMPWVLELRIVGTASVIQLRVSEHMTIGREDPDRAIRPDINLSPYDAHIQGVSRKHAEMQAVANTIMIKDLGSANGTQLNGLTLKAHQPYRLRHGDELTFGRLQVQVLFSVVPLVQSSQDNVPRIANGEHVLLIEEDKDTASVLAMILEQAGFKVTAAHSGLKAMGILQHELPDAIIMDMMLTDVEGENVAAVVKSCRSPQKPLPMLALSGTTGGYQRGKALQAGADEVLSKPVDVDEFIAALQHILPKLSQ